MKRANIKKPIVVIDAFFQLRASTGIRTYTNELCYGVKSLDITEKEFIIIPNIQRVNSFSYFRGSVSRTKGWIFHLLYFFWKQIYLPAFCLYKQADALVCPDYVLPRWELKLLKVGVIHSPFFWQHPEHYNPIWLKLFLGMIKNGFNGRSIAVTTSIYTKDCLSRHLIINAPVEVIYQSAKPILSKEEIGFEDYFDLDKEEFILHVGYFEKRKNLQTLIKAFSRLNLNDEFKHLKLVLAGERATGSSDSYDSIINLIDELGLKGQVILPGYVSEAELSFLYNNALLYVFPSFNEGFGIPVLEAFSQGLPVVVSDSGSLKEVGGDAAVVFQTFDVSDLTQKLADLIRDKDKRQELILKGRARLKKFSRETFLYDFSLLIDKELMK